MAYDQILEQRLRAALGDLPGLTVKKMFGGVGFMLNGNMACGVHADRLIVRVEPERHAELLAQPHVLPFDLTGRPMTGWLLVEAAGVENPADLEKWARLGVSYAASLPSK